MCRRHQVGFEPLEQRIVLSVDPSSVLLSAAQVDALTSGLTSLTQRLTEAQAADMLASSAAGIGQPLGTLISFGDELRTSLTDPLASALSGSLDVAAIETVIQGAVSSADFLSGVTVTATSTTNASGQDVLWLGLNITGSETLPDFELDLGQAGIDGASGLLLDQGLAVGSVAVDLETTLEADLSIGVTLAAGLSTNEMICVKSDSIKVGAEANFTAGAAIAGVDAQFGAVRLGDAVGANVTGSLDIGVNVDLQEGSDGCLSLGALNTGTLSDIFTQTDVSTEFNVTIPFDLDIAGFDEFGHGLEINIGSSDLLDASQISLTLPELHVDGVDFDFGNLGNLSINDVGSLLDNLNLFIPELGTGFELPLIGLDVADLFGDSIDLDWGSFFGGLKSPEGEWTFDTLQELDDFFLNSSIGASIGLTWSPAAEAVEWTLPLSFNHMETAGFESGELIPEGLPLSVAADGELNVAMTANLSLTAGVAITSSANINPVNSTTLLTELNGGFGLTSGMLISGDDLEFNLRDGTVVGVDLDSLNVANGTATVQDLLNLVNTDTDASGNLTLAINASNLVATDHTTPASANATFSIAGPSVNVTIGNTATVQTSLAPIALGLLVQPTTEDTISGSTLEGFSLRDRLYISEGEIGNLTLSVEGGLEGGAAIGPLSLSIYCGAVEGSAALNVSLVDPGTGAADDGRVYLAEMDAGLDASNTGVNSLMNYNVSAPTLDGIFQLRVTPEELEQTLDIDFAADYVDYCGNLSLSPSVTVPDTTLVPYLQLDADLGAEGWAFTIEPSEKLSGVLNGLGDFSLADLPAMLDFFIGYLEGSGLWDFEIPWIDVSLGDVFGFVDIFGNLPEFDLGDLLGRPTGYDPTSGEITWPEFSFGELGGDWLTQFELALPDLSGLSEFGRLQRLSWSLDDLIVEWSGWTPGDASLDLDFISRLRAWFSDALITFDLVLPDFASLGGEGQNFVLEFGRLLSLPQFNWDSEPGSFDAGLDLGWLGGLAPGSLDFPGLDFGGLDSLSFEFSRLFLPQGDGGWLPDGVSLPDGMGVSLNPSLSTDLSGNKQLALDLEVTLVDASYAVDLSALDVADGLALDITSEGNLSLNLGGSISSRLLINLSLDSAEANWISLDTTNSSIDLAASIDDDGGLILGASLGGLVGLSLGGDPAEGRSKATVSLTDGLGNPASLTLNAAGDLNATAIFDANLPIYVDGINLGVDGYLGSLGLDASLNLSADPAFGLDLTYDGNGSGYTDIGDILLDPSAMFSFDGWIDGAAQFVGFLRTALASDLTADLPLISGIDVSDGSFIGQLDTFLGTAANLDTPTELNAALSTEFGNWSSDLTADFSFALDGTTLNATQLNTSFETLLTADAEFVVDLTLASTTNTTLASGDIDFGIDSLGLAVEGDAAINLSTSLTLNIGLGASLTRGFFIEADEDTEFEAGLSLALPADLSMRLGPLSFDFEDATVSDELEANLTVDFGNQSYGLAQLPDLFSNINIDGSVRAEVGANLTASLFDNGPGLGVSLAMGFNEEAEAGGSAVAFSDLTTNTADKFFFEITDTYIDLGGLLSGPVGEIFAQVDTMLEPLRPVLDLLTSEIPVLSDISKIAGGGAVTVLDAMRIFGDDFDSAVTFIETVDQVSDTIATLAGVAGTSRVSLGGFTVDDADRASFLGATSAAAGESAINMTPAMENGEHGIAADPASSDVAEAYSGVTEGSLTFPVFEEPAGVLVDLLFGGNPNLVYWDMPDLEAGFTLSQSFPIFPPLFAKFFGGFEFATDFALGYDTRGIRQAMEGELSASQMAGKMLNGVFLDDVDSGGHDKPELTFTATVGAGAELNVVVAKAGIDAGVRGTLGANLKDNNSDGKVHLDEFVANLRSGPECIFDLEGTIDAFFEAFIKVGLSTPFGFLTLWSDRFELVNVNLFEWNHVSCPPVEPDLANLDSGTLTLHTGPLAGNVLPGETEDSDEEFNITVANGSIVVSAYDFEETFTVADITQIEFDAGIGDDIITFSELVTKPVVGYGGPGNDRLTGGSGKNTFWGDAGSVFGPAGSDRLLGRQADDEFYGGGKNDILYGYGGSDVLRGESGADQIVGDDEAGDLSEAPEGFGSGSAGNDEIYGGADGDMILAGDGRDVVDAGSGDDTVDGGADNDTIEGNAGNDKIYGRDGNDEIWGDDADGAVSGGDVNVNADLIEGGGGFNVIFGGPGYDIIYAMSEDDGVLALPGATQTYSGHVSFVTGSFASWVDGGDGSDSIYGTADRDYLAGGFEADYIETGDGGDFVSAGPGNDGVIVAAGNAEVYLGDGNDIVDGGDGANWIEGGPGDDKIFARGGEDTVYGGSTARSYELRQFDEAHRPIVNPLHGGFSATVAADSCEPDIVFHPEVYPPTQNQVTGSIFEDRNANGVRDASEPDAPANEVWNLAVIDPDWVQVYQVDQSGGEFVLPAEPGLTDGHAVLVVNSKPADWIATTDTVVSLSLPGSAPVELGFYKFGSISGVVIQTGHEQGLQEPVKNATVFLDLDEDGELDAGEPTATTKADGSYEIESVRPGTYQVFVVPPAELSTVYDCPSITPRPAEVDVDSGERVGAISFTIAVNGPPVIEQVLVGSIIKDIDWRLVPDGKDQLVPLDLGDQVTHIAVDVCSVGLKSSRGNGMLHQLDSGGSVTGSLPLVYDHAVGHRLFYAVGSVSQPVSLAVGQYMIELPDAAIVDVSGRVLDGEWAGPPTGDPSGAYYPTGNGTEGGVFFFEFRISREGSQSMAALATVASGAATSSVIQGTVWWHDETPGAAVSRSPSEQGLNGQKVRLVGEMSGITQTTTTADIDLNGDGVISFNETGAFQFTGLPADTYVVSQELTEPWVQKTPGAGTLPAELVAVTHETASAKSSFWKVDPVSSMATLIRDVAGVFAAWDVAAVGQGVVYVTGESLQTSGGVPPGGLWRVNLDTGVVDDLGAIPGDEIIVSLDTLDADNLLGLTANGKLLSYNFITGSWTNHGDMVDKVDGTRYYPVGDLAVVSTSEIYATLDVEQPSPNGVSSYQLLGRIDLTVSGANTVKLQEYRSLSSRLIGLEVDQQGTLVAFTEKHEFFELPTNAAPKPLSNIVGMSPTNTGGFAMVPIQLEPDENTLDFTIEFGAGDTVDIGFGNGPDYELLPDGDDFIDGGCGTDADELHGDDGSDLNWWIVSEGGNDRIRGRGGDDTIYGGLQGDYLYGDAGIDTITGGASEPNRIEGGDDDDTITGGADRDIALGQAGDDEIATLGGNDAVIGGADDDRLNGGDDDDILIGGDGGDEVFGNAGNDVLFVVDVSLGAEFSEQPWSGGVTDLYDGGAGEDLIVVNDDIDITLSNINLQMSVYGNHTVGNIEVAHLTGGASANTIDAAGFSGRTIIRGKGENDILRGGSDTDVIEGGDGDDTITANAGNDTITGGAGTNSLTGGHDDDTYVFNDITAIDTVLESAAGGDDRLDFNAVSSDLTLAVSDGTEAHAIIIEKQAGLLAVQVTNDEVETIQLGAGNNDLRIKNGGSTSANIDAGNGTDRISYQGGYGAWSAWSSTVEVDLAAGTATGFGGIVNVENAEGGNADDTLRGTDLANVLSGYAGNDTLEGRAGDDIYYFVDVTSKDQVDDPSGLDTLDFTSFSSSLTLAVGDGSEPAPVVVIGDTGAFEAQLVSDTIESILLGDGNDFLRAKEGASTVAMVDAGNGTDVVTYQGGYGSWSAWSGDVTVNLESGVAAGFSGILNVEDAHGGDGADTLLGSSGNNALWGFHGDDSIEGFAGDDTLAGGIGADSLAGGLDNDTYAFADVFGNDIIIENPAEGSSDSMDFSAVSAALEVQLGSVLVSDGTSIATHSGDNVEEVIGGLSDDNFVMTGPSVNFPGILDGGGGSNTLWYDDPNDSVVADVESSLTPNVDSAINFEAVSAIEWLENESLSGPVKLGRDYDFDAYINPATPVTYFGGVAKTDFLGGLFQLLEAETVNGNNYVYSRVEAYGRLVKFPASASWMVSLAGLSSAENPVLLRPENDSPTDAGLRLPIEVNGFINLRRDVAGVLYIDNGTALRMVTKDGNEANQLIEPGYRIVGAEIISGTSYILLHDKYFNGMVWTLNSSWEWSSSTTFTDGSTDGLQAEINFNLDINLDGSIGA